jgi:cell shape-determining protein MreC
VQINRTGLRTVAFDGRDPSPEPPNAARGGAGDLVTSGLGGRFPGGYPVAEITPDREKA